MNIFRKPSIQFFFCQNYDFPEEPNLIKLSLQPKKMIRAIKSFFVNRLFLLLNPKTDETTGMERSSERISWDFKDSCESESFGEKVSVRACVCECKCVCGWVRANVCVHVNARESEGEREMECLHVRWQFCLLLLRFSPSFYSPPPPPPPKMVRGICNFCQNRTRRNWI